MLTPAQTSLYWRTWVALCAEHDWRNVDSERRYSVHRAAGCPDSSKTWGNRDFDRFLAHARALLDAREPRDQGITDEAGERRRLIWRIETDLRRANLPDAYAKKIIADQAGLGCWRILALDQLRTLRDTIHQRVRRATAAHPRYKRHAPPRHGQCTAQPTRMHAPVECPF